MKLTLREHQKVSCAVRASRSARFPVSSSTLSSRRRRRWSSATRPCVKTDSRLMSARSKCYDRVELGALLRRISRLLPRTAGMRVAGLAASLAGIALLRYTTGPTPSFLHELSLRLYYGPILMAAYWYGAVGGLVVASV